jgi:hypothetical protein
MGGLDADTTFQHARHGTIPMHKMRAEISQSSFSLSHISCADSRVVLQAVGIAARRRRADQGADGGHRGGHRARDPGIQ